jgi:hypothetical protein
MAEDVYELAVRWMVAAVQGGVVARYVKGWMEMQIQKGSIPLVALQSGRPRGHESSQVHHP